MAEMRASVDAGTKTTPPSAHTLEEAAEATASKVAFAWLAKLAKHDAQALLAASRVPFVLREARGRGHCKNAMVKDADQLLPALQCLLADATVAKVLRANSDPQGGPVPRKYLPNWAEKWTEDVGPNVYPIAIVVVGESASFDFLILATPDGVHGLFKHISHEAQN